MRFREIKEIREIKDDKKEEEHNEFLRIKPETDITEQEAQDFFDRLFGQEKEV